MSAEGAGFGAKLVWFSLVPWPHLPADFRERHRSVWVDIPSSRFDPALTNRLYHRYMERRRASCSPRS